MERVIGIDGCRGGWVRCCFSTDGAISFEIRSAFREAVGDVSALTLVDIPIGLACKGDRAVDVEAKRVLGRRHMCVFPAPPRSVLAMDDYAAASAESHACTGRKLSKQAWNIVPKIREADEAMQTDATARECHPEICLWGLTGHAVMQPKKTAEGAAIRLEILERVAPGVADAASVFLATTPRHVVVRDDVIDAAICAVAAAGVWEGTLRTLPDDPPRDEHGLAMEMVYRIPV